MGASLPKIRYVILKNFAPDIKVSFQKKFFKKIFIWNPEIANLVYPENHWGFAHGIPDIFLTGKFWNDAITASARKIQDDKKKSPLLERRSKIRGTKPEFTGLIAQKRAKNERRDG